MIITITGNNTFAVRAELDRRIKAYVDEHGDMGLEKFDGEEAEAQRMVEALQNMPFLASKKLIVLRNVSANKEFTAQFEALLPTVPDTNDVIIHETKLDKRSSYAKALQKKTEFISHDELSGHELPGWLVDEAKKGEGTLSISDANYLIQRVGATQQLLNNELHKLLAYNPRIDKETINLLTDQAPQSTVFDLLDAALNGNTKRAVELYEEQRQLKVEPLQIIAMLGWQLHVLAVIKTAGSRDPATVSRETKINPYVVRKSMTLARRLTLQDLKQLIDDVQSLDVRLKSESIDSDEAMLFLLMNLRK